MNDVNIKRRLLILFNLFVLSIIFTVAKTYAGTVEGVSPTVTLTSIKVTVNTPNGGENWEVGSTQQISWNYIGPAGKNVIIEYSTNSGTDWQNVTTVLATSSPYNWTVPNTSTTQAKVRIKSVDYAAVADTSNAAFSIVATSITVTSPNGGENWQVGSSQNITWTSSNVTNVKLEYTTNNGTDWTDIIASTPASSGSYSWTIPNTPSTQCKVRISDVSNSAIGDTSNNVFTISIPYDPCNGITSVNYLGKTYNTVAIDSQCWFKENLNIGTRINGSQEQTNNSVIEKYCYNDNESNCDTYGGFYQWNEAMQYVTTPGTQGICPTGWHIPTIAEFQTLASAVGNDGNALKAVGQGSGNGAGTNTSGFSALLAGVRGPDGLFVYITYVSNIWSSTENDVNEARRFFVYELDNTINNSYPNLKTYGFNIRCIKDEALSSSIQITFPNGGENWQVGSNQNITWTSSNITNVKLEYTTNNGTNWTNIIASTPANTGTYSWTIPNTPSTQCKVRILDTSNSSIGDTSNNVFSISTPYDPCSGVTSVNYLGKIYNTVAIDSQCWLKENLNVGTRINGSNNQTNNSTIEKYCYDDLESNCDTYGGLYQWDEAMQYSTTAGARGICPSGWHIPTLAQLQTLASSVGNNSNALKAVGQGTGSGAGTNTSGFSALLAGHRNSNGSFSDLNGYADFWSSTESSASNANYLYFISFVTNIYFTNHGKQVGFSIRCIKEQTTSSIQITTPNGGENWQISSSQNITWTSSNVTNVKIEYTTNNGTNWLNIIASTPASTGSYTWTIPNTPSTQCKVRISDVSNQSIGDTSNNVFTIYKPSVTITKPSGGENWFAGSTQTISFSKFYVGPVQLDYSTDNGISWLNIIPSITTDTVYNWKIPITPSAQCRVRVRDIQYNYGDTSNVFTISLLELTSPNGGEQWQVNTQQNITWNIKTSTSDKPLKTKNLLYEDNGTIEDSKIINYQKSGEIKTKSNADEIDSKNGEVFELMNDNPLFASTENLKIQYTTNNGTSWIDIISSIPLSNLSYSWTVPNTPSTQCKVRIVDVLDPAVGDTSNNNFAITTQPVSYIVVSTPNGGENWQVGSVDTIRWSSGNVTNVKIEYTTNNGTSWMEIISSTSAVSGKYAWTIPNTPSTQCKVRILDASNSAIGDTSNNMFTISIPLTPLVTIVSPNGGENWQVSTSQNITWTSSNVTNVKLEYTTNDGTDWLSIENSVTASTGSYAWTIPNTPSTQCKVRITDASNSAIGDTSDNLFTISTPAVSSVSLVSPNGGENWQISTSQNITWTSSNITTVKLEYTTNNGTDWLNIENSVSASTGSYTWIIPNTPSTQCKVRVTDASNSAIGDTSDNLFTISTQVVPSVTLVSPNGGENWQVSTSQNITWTSSNVTNVKLEYTTNDGADWISIENSFTASAGSYSWSIPNTQSNQCKVKVSDSSNQEINDISDGVFTIYLPALTLTSPTSGDNLRVGGIKNITWTGSYVDNVKIEYSIDNGTTWNDIVSTTPSNGSYSWTIPNTPSSQCKVKVTDVTEPSINSISNGTFTIFEYPSIIPVTATISFVDAFTQSSYKMIGLPGNIDIPMSQLLSGANKTDWKAFYDNGAAENYLVSYDGSTTFNFKPGKGFWILSKNNINISKDYGPVALSVDNTYSITLQNGWNIISNPFEKNVSWNLIKTINSVTQPIYFFNQGYTQPVSFEPYKGYYFFNQGNLPSLKIPYNPGGVVNQQFKLGKKNVEGGNSIIASLIVAGEEKSVIEVNINSGSSNDIDIYDVFSPPDDFESAGIYIENIELTSSYKKLKIESRKEVSEGESFTIRNKNITGLPVQLRFTGMEEFSQYEVYLIDNRINKFHNLKEVSSINFSGNYKSNTVTLLLGSRDYIQTKMSELAPSEYVLYQNYPNPFNPYTFIRYSLPLGSNVKLEIFNALGERIETLINGFNESGYYEIEWNASGYSSGVYFYRLQARDYSDIKKMIYLR